MVILNATITGLFEEFFIQLRSISEVLTADAWKLDGSFEVEQLIKQKVISFVELFSVMLISG